MTLYPPKDARARLRMSATALRRYSAVFADHLSPTAGSAIGESGGPAQRRYTDRDLALLDYARRQIEARRTFEEVLAQLNRHGFEPAAVVVGDDAGDGTARQVTEQPPAGEMVPAAGGPGDWLNAVALELVAVNDRALAELRPTLDALVEVGERHNALLEEIVAALREPPPAPPAAPWWKRLFTRSE